MKLMTTLLLIALCCGLAFSQRKRATTSGFSTQEINIEAKSLPPGYMGNSLPAVHAILNQRREAEEKREFETSEQFYRRVKEMRQRPIVGVMTIASRFAFVLQDNNAVYDADNHNLHLAITTDYTQVTRATALPMHERQLTITALWDEQVAGSYVGQNAFGVTKRITSYVKTKWYLEVPGDALKQGETIDFDVDLQQAPHYKRNLRFLLIGTLRQPYADSTADFTEATIDKPRELTTREHSVYFEPEAWWLYDYSNGRIIHKQSLLNNTLVAAEKKQESSTPAELPIGERITPPAAVTVYRAPGSPFFHYTTTCPLYTKAAVDLPLEEARKLAHACSQCKLADQSGAQSPQPSLPDWAVDVYIVPGGTVYHLDASCQLASSAKPATLAAAKKASARPCPRCAPKEK